VVGVSFKFAISLRQCLGCMIGVFLWCLAVSILKVVKGKLTPSFCRARVLLIFMYCLELAPAGSQIQMFGCD